MSVDYTQNLGLGKPTVLNSLNVWGNELNDIFDIIDFSVISNNFGEDESSHSSLNFGYFGGRVLNGTTMNNVSASTVLLTDNQTNYIEVNLSGTVSANTTGFTNNSIPLFTVITAGGSITNVTDKRAYMQPNHPDINSLTNSIINTDSNGNVLFNGAIAETSSQKALTIKQGVDPTTSTQDQVSIFATAGSDCTLGLRTEQNVVNDKIRININGTDKFFHCYETALNPISEFITNDIVVANTVVETEIMSVTLPGRNPAGGQLLLIDLRGIMDQVSGSTLTLYLNVNTDLFYFTTSGSPISSSQFDVNWELYVKDNNNYNVSNREFYLANSWFFDSVNAAEDFTNDVIVKVTALWDTALAGNSITFQAGCIQVKN